MLCHVNVYVLYRYGDTNTLPSVNQIITVMKSLHHVDASYWKCWKAQEVVKDMIRGTSEDNYKGMPSYLYMLMHSNPGTVVHLERDANNRFKYLFLAFGQSIRGYQAMRKVRNFLQLFVHIICCASYF